MRISTSKHLKWVPVLLTAFGLVSPAHAQFYRAPLSGADDVPSNTSTATGAAIVHLNGNQVTLTGAFHGLSAQYYLSHIHEGPPGVNGPIRFDLTPALDADGLGGRWEPTNTTTFSDSLVTALKSSGLYVNVHPRGGISIRGQLLETVVISELRTKQAGGGEYFELAGAAGASLDGFTYVVIGTGSTTGSGTIEYVQALEGRSIPADGHFLAGGGDVGVTVDFPLNSAFEIGDDVTHLLVTGFAGARGDDLDTNDDGALDARPWTGVVDAVGMADASPTGTVYATSLGFVDLSANETLALGHAFRDGGTGTWRAGAPDSVSGQDTPGATNVATEGERLPAHEARHDGAAGHQHEG